MARFRCRAEAGGLVSFLRQHFLYVLCSGRQELCDYLLKLDGIRRSTPG